MRKASSLRRPCKLALAVQAGERVRSVAQRYCVGVDTVYAACSRSGVKVDQRSIRRSTFDALLDQGTEPYQAAIACGYEPTGVATLVRRWKQRRGITGRLSWKNIASQIDRA